MEIVKQMFEGIEVRAVQREGEVWIMAADVTRALEIGNPTQALKRLDEDEVALISNEGSGVPVNYISESGLYSLILGSRKPQAKPFKRWVTHDLLPTLRRTGFYSTREPVITAAGIARAYSRPATSIPVWLEHYGLRPVGYAENPETGKPVLVYRVEEVRHAFRHGHQEGMTDLRPYSGAWEAGPIPVEKLPLSRKEQNRVYREARDRAEEARRAHKPLH